MNIPKALTEAGAKLADADCEVRMPEYLPGAYEGIGERTARLPPEFDRAEAFWRHLSHSEVPNSVAGALVDLGYMCHGMSYASGWWHDIRTGEPLQANVGEKLMLAVSELAEAMEADRKGLMDDKLPHRPGIEVELADAVIRIFDLAACGQMDLPGAIVEKLAYNAHRADHKPANRANGGKAY